MRVSARFNGQGLELVLHAETDPEKKMIGAVLNQPFADPSWQPCEVDNALLAVTIHYDGHWSNKSVDRLELTVHRQESSAPPGDQQ